jgi:hypothetical protein
VQLDRVPPPRVAPVEIDRTPETVDGVHDGDDRGGCRVAAPHRRAGVRSWGLLTLVLLTLLGQGERYQVDRRFLTPGSTLVTYWDALRRGDADTAWRCLIDVGHDAPFPGMLWFLPETDAFRLESVRSLPVTAGRVMVSYEVRFRPVGESTEQAFPTGNELVRVRGEWRIARGIGQATMPEWRPTSRPVDI